MGFLLPKQLIFLLIFFLPGFVILKTYDLLVPNDQRDFSKQFLDAIVYSIINFFLFFWLYDRFAEIFINGIFHIIPWLYGFSFFFILPIFCAFLFVKLTTSSTIEKHIISPIKRPWDWLFSKKESLWVIVELTDGRKIGGILDQKSYTSSYPAEEQIYLEEVWKLDENGRFCENGKIEDTKGIIIFGRNISTIEFFK